MSCVRRGTNAVTRRLGGFNLLLAGNWAVPMAFLSEPMVRLVRLKRV